MQLHMKKQYTGFIRTKGLCKCTPMGAQCRHICAIIEEIGSVFELNKWRDKVLHECMFRMVYTVFFCIAENFRKEHKNLVVLYITK